MHGFNPSSPIGDPECGNLLIDSSNNLTNYVNIIVTPKVYGELTLQPHPTFPYNLVDGGGHLQRVDNPIPAHKIMIDAAQGYRINTYDSNGYLVESIFGSLITENSYFNPAIGNPSLMDYIRSVVKPIQFDDIEVILQVNPSDLYYLLDDCAHIMRVDNAEVVYTIVIDAIDGSRINSYDVNGYLLESIYQPIV